MFGERFKGEKMKKIVETLFEVLAVAFYKIPLLNKLKGYRSIIGFVGLAVFVFLDVKGIGDKDLLKTIEVGLTGFTALALNAKQK